jgi:hypothetical protein
LLTANAPDVPAIPPEVADPLAPALAIEPQIIKAVADELGMYDIEVAFAFAAAAVADAMRKYSVSGSM